MTDNDDEPRSVPADRDIPSQSNQNLTQQQQQQPQLSIEQQLVKVKRDLESMVIRYAKSESENLINKAKSEELDKKLKRAIKDNDSLANRIKILTNDKVQLNDSLNAKVAQLMVSEQKNRLLSSTQCGKLHELEAEIDQLRLRNEELIGQIDTYKSKEGELLDFSERLSMKLVLVQTELDKSLESTPDYKTQYEQLVKENSDLNCQIEELTKMHQASQEDLENERKVRKKVCEERDELELKCKRNVEELENEMKVLRRRHQMATKELLKQMRCIKGSLDKTNPQSGNKVIS